MLRTDARDATQEQESPGANPHPELLTNLPPELFRLVRSTES
jgi:hypothetical protein